MKKSKLPPDIEGIVKETAKFLHNRERRRAHIGSVINCEWIDLPLGQVVFFRKAALDFLSKLTEHGARIKINGKWYGLDGTVKEG